MLASDPAGEGGEKEPEGEGSGHQALIIGSLPFCMAAVMTLTSYEYIALLWRADMGHYMIAGGFTLIAMGTFIMWRMISFEV